MLSGSSRLSGSNHSAIEEDESRIGFLSWTGARGSAESLVKIAKESKQWIGLSGFLVGSDHQSKITASASMPLSPGLISNGCLEPERPTSQSYSP